MEAEIEALLHPRIAVQCTQLYEDTHYVSAAREAMVTVEVALREKSGLKDITGTNLVNHLFGGAPGIRLVTPFGDERQSQAAALFRGAFVYYRNYGAHDGQAIDKRISLRIMIIASELLEILDASRLSYAAVGGAQGLVKIGLFEEEGRVYRLLTFLDGSWHPNGVVDGFYEDMFGAGFTDQQLAAIIDMGLVAYKNEFASGFEHDWVEDICYFELTQHGRDVLAEAGTATS